MPLPSQTFRVQFLAAASERGPMVLDERNILARDVDAAIKEAVSLLLPVGSRSLRLVDLDGCAVLEHVYPDFR